MASEETDRMAEGTPELCDCEIRVTDLMTSFFGAQMFWRIDYCPLHKAALHMREALAAIIEDTDSEFSDELAGCKAVARAAFKEASQ